MKISLEFARKGLTTNIPALVQIMACHRIGDKPLSKPIVVRLLRRFYDGQEFYMSLQFVISFRNIEYSVFSMQIAISLFKKVALTWSNMNRHTLNTNLVHSIEVGLR